MRVALVCIAKDEDNYIEEWINYYLKLGFDDIFIYENDWRYKIKHNNIHTIPFDGDNMQETAYNNFIQTYHTKYDWVAFFDIDEFLVLKKHKNIKEFIGDYSNYYAIGINWVYFGDNGILFDGNYSLISRFTKRQIGVDSHVKCIIKLDPRIEYSIHQPKNFEVVDTNFNTFTGPFNPIGDDNIAHINHYYCRTWEEWINKKNRGRADVPLGHNEHFISDILFFERNLNDIEDTSALDFYLK